MPAGSAYCRRFSRHLGCGYWRGGGGIGGWESGAGVSEPALRAFGGITNGQTHRMAITVGDNGFIVGANPTSLP